MRRGVIRLLLIVVFAGCSSAPPPARSALEENAIAANQRGQDAWRHGDFTGALEAYEDAQRIWLSMDRLDAAAGELLNSATVRYRLGQYDAARHDLDQVLAQADAIAASTRADAAYRRAHIELETGHVSAVTQWLEQSSVWCGGSCPVAGRILNLRARLLLAQADATGAEALAQRSLGVNRANKDGAEEANALRLLAQIFLSRQLYVQAEASYSQALALDRSIAEPYKIIADLLGLARSVLPQGNLSAAVDFARRARASADSVGDILARDEADRILADIAGKRPKSPKL